MDKMWKGKQDAQTPNIKYKGHQDEKYGTGKIVSYILTTLYADRWQLH